MKCFRKKRLVIKAIIICAVLSTIGIVPVTAAPQTYNSITSIEVYDIPYFVKKARGSVVFLRVYAMYCPSCRNDLSDMNQLAYECGGYPVTFLNFCCDDESTDLERLVKSNNNIYFEPFWIKKHPEGSLTENIKRVGGNYPKKIPYTLILDRQGRARTEFTGGYEIGSYYKLINQLLNEK